MPKTVLRLNADKQTLATGERWEIDRLLAQFKNPAETLDNDGLPLKTHLWRRQDGLDVVSLALDHRLPLSASDLFEAVADRVDQLVPFHTSAPFPDWMVERLARFEAAGLDLRAQDSEHGKTLIQRVADCEIFLGGVLEFLESRGLDPLARTAGKKSAFERALRLAEREEFDTLVHDAVHPDSDVASFLTSVSSRPSLAEQERNGVAGLGGFLSAKESRELGEARARWLEHCVELGGAVPKKWASHAEASMTEWMRTAGLSKAWKGRNPIESPLRARLEAAEIRRALGMAGAPASGAAGAARDATTADGAATRATEANGGLDRPKRASPRI
jgi:hypothetical protein